MAENDFVPISVKKDMRQKLRLEKVRRGHTSYTDLIQEFMEQSE